MKYDTTDMVFEPYKSSILMYLEPLRNPEGLKTRISRHAVSNTIATMLGVHCSPQAFKKNNTGFDLFSFCWNLMRRRVWEEV